MLLDLDVSHNELTALPDDVSAFDALTVLGRPCASFVKIYALRYLSPQRLPAKPPTAPPYGAAWAHAARARERATAGGRDRTGAR